jgi:hypothetical protein
MLFLHFLVMTSTLFRLPGVHELGHTGENLIHPPQVPVHEVTVVDLEEPVVLLVFLN